MIGNCERVKSWLVAPGLANARSPDSAKFVNTPPPGTDKAGKCPTVVWGGGGAGCSWNWLMHNNYIDVYIIWVTLEALFPNLQCTTKCCKNATRYRKIFIFLNQMLLNMFTHVLLTQIKCISGLLHSFSEKIKKKHTHTRVTYSTCAYQFNKFVLINYNTHVALLTSLTNWLPWGKWNSCLLFLWARYKAKRYWLQNIIQLNW